MSKQHSILRKNPKNKENVVLWHDRKNVGTGEEQDDFQPFMVIHLLKTENPRAVVVVCPSGGYGCRAIHEGTTIADKFNALGLSAFVIQPLIVFRLRRKTF